MNLVNRRLRAIGATLALTGALLCLVRQRLPIDHEDFYVLVYLLLFVGFGLVLWVGSKRNRKAMRIIVWPLTLLNLCEFTLLFKRIPNKAILIFLALALLA